MSEWIDFKAVRRDLKLESVFKGYGITLNVRDTPNGRQHSGPCPLKACRVKGSAKPNFSANLDQSIWRCFGCGGHGNVLDLILLLEGLDPSKGADVRKGALLARKKFLGQPSGAETTATARAPGENGPPREPADIKTVINEPLDFSLKYLDSSHEWFKARGLKPETVKHFGLGASSRGALKGRIAIPLHDDAGKLLGYGGLVVDERQVTAKTPWYLFPEPRIRNGVRHVLDRGRFLYHDHAVKKPVSRLLVVPDMETVWWLWQHGYGHVVSTMGNSCEDAQAKRALSLLSLSGTLAVLAQKSEDGSRFACDLMARCGQFCAVRWFATEQHPLKLDAVTLQSLLGLADTPVS